MAFRLTAYAYTRLNAASTFYIFPSAPNVLSTMAAASARVAERRP